MDLISPVLRMLGESFSAVSIWFLTCIGSVKGENFYLTMVFITLLFGYLLSPILSSNQGSDTATSKRKDKR